MKDNGVLRMSESETKIITMFLILTMAIIIVGILI